MTAEATSSAATCECPSVSRYVNVAETLREAMTQNRDLKVFVANGYYDLATVLRH